MKTPFGKSPGQRSRADAGAKHLDLHWGNSKHKYILDRQWTEGSLRKKDSGVLANEKCNMTHPSGYAHSHNGLSHPGLHQEQLYQQAERGLTGSLVHASETPPGALHPALGPLVKERCGLVEVSPEEGHEGHAGVSASMMKKRTSHNMNHLKWEGEQLFSNAIFKQKFELQVHLEASSRISDAHLADTMIGKAVEHMFETEDGSKDEWRGMVLARAPIMNTWFYITYEKDPVLYMYQLLDDYKEGDLRIMPDSNDSPPAEREPGEVVDSLVGKQVEYAKEDGSKRTGMVIHQVEAKPSVYFIKFDDDFHIYVYDLVKTS
ncbi:hypothetical protein DUI87_03597 [Hirundo rustica rustica]|uniref:Spindlin-1 n=2 Tax=Neognathae TaxID=8825 RepID=A0A3M0L0M8_HIRRU|nr:hypothetical protein DUI87_03597 [Hirundo rustica rustica]